MKERARVADERHEQPTNGGSRHGKIAERAYEIFLVRGGTDGQDVEDWLRAEAELRGAES